MNEAENRKIPFYEGKSEADTLLLGRVLASMLPDGTVIGLIGTLGAGKTHLVTAVAQACGIAPQDTGSPTFVLIREYHGNRAIYHFDAYRLRDEDEFGELGPEEYFYGDGLSFVEWADRVENILPPERLDIEIEITGNDTRLFRLIGHGDDFRRLANEMATRPELN